MTRLLKKASKHRSTRPLTPHSAPHGRLKWIAWSPTGAVFYTNEQGETERMDDVDRTDKVAQLKNQIAKNCQ